MSRIEVAKAEMRLGKAARKAVEAKTEPTRRKYVDQLFLLATIDADQLELFEGTTDPYEISKGALKLTALDERIVIFGELPEEIDPTDAYSLRLERMRQNLPKALSTLDKLIQTISN